MRLIISIIIGSSLPGFFDLSGHRACASETSLFLYIVTLSVNSSDEVHPLRKAQIVYLKMDEASTKVSSEYIDFEDIFSPKLAAKFSKYTRINNYTMELIDDWQPLYYHIYSLESVKLIILKAYNKNKLANGFIRLFKSLIEASIFFDKKPGKSLRLYVNY